MVRGDQEAGGVRSTKPAALSAAQKKQAETFLATLFAAGSQETLRSRDGDALASAAAYAYRCYLQTSLPFLQVFRVPSSDPLGAPRRFLIAINRDRPFLVDTTLAACAEAGVAVRLLLHPIYRVQREGKGTGTGKDRGKDSGKSEGKGVLRALASSNTAKASSPKDHSTQANAQAYSAKETPGKNKTDSQTESLLLVELSPEALGKMASLRRVVAEAIDDLIRATDDWQEMLKSADTTAQELEQAGAGQAAAYLRWLMDDHFTFLGTLIGKGRASKSLRRFHQAANRPQGAHEPKGVVEVWKARTLSRVHLSLRWI